MLALNVRTCFLHWGRNREQNRNVQSERKCDLVCKYTIFVAVYENSVDVSMAFCQKDKKVGFGKKIFTCNIHLIL